METLFGLPMLNIAAGLTATLLILISAIAIIAIRNRFLIKLHCATSLVVAPRAS